MQKSRTPLKIAFVYDDSLDGYDGVAQYVKTLGSWLSQRGHQTTYFTGQTKTKSWASGRVYSLSKNWRVNFNGNSISTPLLSGQSSIIKALRAEKPDVLHVQMPHSPFMAQRVINISRLPAVGTFHILPASQLVRVASWFLRLLYFGQLKRIKKVISVSRPAQQFAHQTFGLQSEVIPNMVNLEKFKQAKASKLNRKIVFVGRLVERKGAHQLIEAFADVLPEVPEAQLIIGGDGPERAKLEELAIALGVAESVQFIGYVEEQNKPALLASATIACFPSLYGESFGIVLLEAMAAGAGVVIGGSNPGYASVLEGNQAVLIDPTDKQAFTNMLLHNLTDDHHRVALHDWQQQLVAKYDVNKVGCQIEDLYYQVIA